ncbi:hypothetical protein NNO_2044 [Hydrogenimonas sp.]|nr:hypothetical protein NNO_2044 [Hydrogenimonas sp.]
MERIKILIFSFSILFSGGCGNTPVVKIYPKGENAHIECLSLDIYPMNDDIRRSLEKLYPFDPSCKTVLEVRHKENISCNANHNAFHKAVGGFPGNFLRMEVRKGLTLLYSYYIDLDSKAGAEDAKRAFERIKRDLDLSN